MWADRIGEAVGRFFVVLIIAVSYSALCLSVLVAVGMYTIFATINSLFVKGNK